MSLFTSCSLFVKEKIVYVPKVEKIYVVPDKIETIDRPDLEVLDEDSSYCDLGNVEIELETFAELVNYIKQLERKIKQYEEKIDALKREMENNE